MMEDGPAGLIKFAARAGLNKVCLFTETPMAADGSAMFPVVQPAEARSFRTLLRDHGLSITNAEYFPVVPDGDVSHYRPSLDLAAELGAKRVVTHIHEEEEHRIADQLAALCGLAGQRDMEVGLEFTGFAAGCNNLPAAVSLYQRINAANLCIAIDVLHLLRTGGTLEMLRSLDPDMIGYAQICDGPHMQVTADYIDEAMNRMIPGQGVFPLEEFITLLGAHVDLDIEVPNFHRPQDHDAQKWARSAIAASQALIEKRNREE